MAANAHTQRRARWERAFNKYQELKLNLALTQAPPEELESIGNALAKQVDTLMELPAPHLAAVMQKLHILWEADLEKADQDAVEKAQIISDLHDLAMAASDVIGFEYEPQLQF